MTEKEENRMEKDMTAGTPGKIIFNFTMPIFIGNIFQQFYNMADTVIVGKFVGNAALAAVGACGTWYFPEFFSNLVLGRGRRLAVEADELLDRSFLRLWPERAGAVAAGRRILAITRIR